MTRLLAGGAAGPAQAANEPGRAGGTVHDGSPVQVLLADLLRDGHRAASWQMDEVAGEWRGSVFVDEDVECQVRVRGAEGARIVPLAALGQIVAAGFTIEDVAAPGECWCWEAVSYQLGFGPGPAGILVPKVYFAAVRDGRGLAAMVLSEHPVPDGGATLGERLTRALQNTYIPGAAGRVRITREQLSDEDARGAVAFAAHAYFQSNEALTDGGVPPVEFVVVEADPSTRVARVLAKQGDWDSAGLNGSKRRSQLFEEVLRELEADAFGGRGNAERIFEPLPDPDYSAFGASRDFSDEVVARLDVADLVARADLTPREYEVFELMGADKTQAEIAATLGIAVGTVKPLRARVRHKLEAAAVETLSEYRQSA